jgi:DNA-binding HxlR family transcriptional regulator
MLSEVIAVKGLPMPRYNGLVNDRYLCGHFHRAIELIGRRWNGAIIFVLLPGRARFCELRAAIPEITDRMLTERLQELEREGIVARTVVPETPVRVEYALTSKGKSLGDTIQTITAWASKWLPKTPAHADKRTATAAAGRRRLHSRPDARADARLERADGPHRVVRSS